MIKLYCGSDTFESYVEAKRSAASFREAADPSAEIKIIEFDELNNISDFDINLEGIGLFQQKSILFVKRILQNNKLLKIITENFERYNQFDIFAWEDRNADGKLNFVKLLKSKKQVFSYTQLTNNEYKNWCNNYLKKKGIKLNSQQLENLILISSNNKWVFINEIKKLDIFIKSNSLIDIPNNDFNKIISGNITGDIWSFLDFFSSKKTAQAITELKRLLENGSNIHLIISMLINELTSIHKLLFAKENGISQNETKIHPFAIKKYSQKLNNFSIKSIELTLQEILNLDYNIKRGDVDELSGILQFVYNFTSKIK